MATIAEMFVNVGADVTEFEREIDSMDRHFHRMSKQFRRNSYYMNRDMKYMSDEAKALKNDMRKAFQDQRMGMIKFKEEQIKIKHGFFKMTQAAKDYKGTSKQFINDVEAMGQKLKKVKDDMLRNNEMAKMGIIKSVGTILARSTQSEKIAENFNRMNNPLYKVNNGLLKITQSYEKMAKAGQPAVLALKMLGPTANMKQLRDMTMLISQGLMRLQFVAIGAGVAAGVAYYFLTKAALGPKPSEIRARQEEIAKVYRDTFNDRVKEIKSFAGLFEKVTLKAVKKIDLTKALKSQVQAMKTWMKNLAGLAKRGVDEGLIKELQAMGPGAAMEIKALNSMTDKELNEYVALWKEKNSLAVKEATTELAKMKEETKKQIDELEKTLTPLGLAAEKMMQNLSTAFGPMVEVFGAAVTPLVNFISKLAEMATKFNEAHPTLAKVIAGFLLLIPLLTVILAPLSIGIGLFGGMRAAFAATWMLIGPLVTGLGAMMGTVILVAAAIVFVVWALTTLWKKNEGFRNAVISAWEAIKNTAQKVWNFIYNNAIKPAIEAIATFVREKIIQIKQWWAQNGEMILQATRNVWTFISSFIKHAITIIGAIFQVVFPIIKEIVVSTWNFIKDAITAAIDIITGVINFFAALFTGDWEALWEATKQILSGAVTLLVSLFKNSFIGKIIGILISFGEKARNTLSTTWDQIKAATSFAVNYVKNLISSRFTAAKNLLFSILNSIKQAFINTWNRIKSAVSNAINNVKTIIGNGIRGALNIVRNLGTAFYNAGKKIVTMIADGIKAAIGKVTNAISWVAKKARDYLPFSPAKIGPLSDLHQLDFGGPITDSVAKAAPIVQKMLGKVLTLPPLNTANLGYSMDFTNNLETAPLNHEFAPIYVHITGETGQLNNDAIARAVEKRITQNLKHGARRLPNRAAFSGVR